MTEELASLFFHFFLCIFTFVKVKAIKLSSSDRPAAWKPRGAGKTECDFKGRMLGGVEEERKKKKHMGAIS